MNPGATENLSHLWVLDKFRVVQRLADLSPRSRRAEWPSTADYRAIFR
jgi:hypothetical protein